MFVLDKSFHVHTYELGTCAYMHASPYTQHACPEQQNGLVYLLNIDYMTHELRNSALLLSLA